MADTVENQAGVKVNVEPNTYFNNLTGKYEEGVRDPDTHVIKFASTPDSPEQDPNQNPNPASVRADELGVNLDEVEGTGDNGEVTVQDVENHHTAAQS